MSCGSIFMNIVIESKCNQTCSFCFAHEILSQKNIPERMELSEIEFLISFFGDKPRKINIIGGEPTLHPQLLQIIKSFYNAGHLVTLITNTLTSIDTMAQCLPYLAGVLVNYRHPDSYTAKQSKQIKAVMDLLVTHRKSRPDSQQPFSIDLGVTFTKVGQDYQYLLAAAEKYTPRAIRWDLSKPSANHKNNWLDPFENPTIGDWIVTFIKQFDEIGIGTCVDCPVPYCIFSDTQIHFLEKKVERFRGRCNPPLDILPGLSAIHCFPLAGVCEPVLLSEVGTYDNLFRFIAGLVRKGTLDVGLMEKCHQCHWYIESKCQGYCPALRLNKV